MVAARQRGGKWRVRRARKKLSSIGNSLGLVIEKPILELLAIDRETELEMTTDGDRLIIEPVRSPRQARLRAAARRAMDAHDSTFRKLAKRRVTRTS